MPKAAPKPDLTAELANLTQTPPVADAPAADAPAADANAPASVTAEEQAQLDREKAAVEAIAAGATVAQAVASTKTPEELGAQALADLAARRKAAGVQYYFATGSRAISDPETGKSFSNDKGTKSELTGWVELQLAHGKLRTDDE